mgnify:CR=1 FL=1
MSEKSTGSLAAPPPERHYALPSISVPKVPKGTLYRGNTALVRVSPEAYNAVINSYKTPIMGLAELGLVGAIGFHALNGLRIILIDFWSVGPKYHKLMFGIVLLILAVLMIGFAPRHLMNVFGE